MESGLRGVQVARTDWNDIILRHVPGMHAASCLLENGHVTQFGVTEGTPAIPWENVTIACHILGVGESNTGC